MRRFLLPASFAVIAAMSLPVAGGFGEDVRLSPASPPSTSPSETQSGKREATEHRAADLRRQVSDLQNLVAQVREQIEQRTARKPPPTDSGEQQALRQQDGELHNELKGLIAELE